MEKITEGIKGEFSRMQSAWDGTVVHDHPCRFFPTEYETEGLEMKVPLPMKLKSYSSNNEPMWKSYILANEPFKDLCYRKPDGDVAMFGETEYNLRNYLDQTIKNLRHVLDKNGVSNDHLHKLMVVHAPCASKANYVLSVDCLVALEPPPMWLPALHSKAVRLIQLSQVDKSKGQMYKDSKTVVTKADLIDAQAMNAREAVPVNPKAVKAELTFLRYSQIRQEIISEYVFHPWINMKFDSAGAVLPQFTTEEEPLLYCPMCGNKKGESLEKSPSIYCVDTNCWEKHKLEEKEKLLELTFASFEYNVWPSCVLRHAGVDTDKV